MHILVTGGCGYKGSVLTQMLLDQGHHVTVLDSMWFGNHLPEHLHSKVNRVDVRETEKLPKADAMIHLAAVANDPSALLDPKLSWEINALATNHLLDLCVKAGIPRFIYASSGSVYGVKPDNVEVTECLDLVPISEYNKTKQIAERVVMSYKKDLNVTILRPATVCGMSPRMRLDVAVNALTYSALSKGVITVFGGAQIRPNVHIKDICQAYIWCLENELISEGQVYNVGFENLSLMDLAHTVYARVHSLTGRKVSLKVEESNDPRSYRVSSEKILAAGFKPRYGVVDGINDMVKAYKDGDFEKLDIDQCYNTRWMQRWMTK